MPLRERYRKVSDNPELGWHNLKRSKILQLGLGDAILTKREEGWSMTKISELFELDRFTVKVFLENFEAMPPDLRAQAREEMRRRNIWDLITQTQLLFESIQRKIEELDGTDDRLMREYVAEQRQLIDHASTLLEKAARLDHQKKMMNVILSEIAKEEPKVRERILKRLRGLDELNLLFGGSV